MTSDECKGFLQLCYSSKSVLDYMLTAPTREVIKKSTAITLNKLKAKFSSITPHISLESDYITSSVS